MGGGRSFAWTLALPLLAACHSRALIGAPVPDGSGSPDAGQTDTADEAPTSQLYAPCDVDADCGHPFLSCRSQPFSADETPVTRNVCVVRYQQPCTVDADCGPSGFRCNADKRCHASAGGLCLDASGCPAGWLCSAECACFDAAAPMLCQPPFAETRCPDCMPIPDTL